MKTQIFITGGTGYIGSRLIASLLVEGGYRIHALVRRGSEHKIPDGCNMIYGDALDANSYKNGIPIDAILVHLARITQPSPAKKHLFKKIDGVSLEQAVIAAKHRHVSHFIYVSVSPYPSKVMNEYQHLRADGERYLKQSGLSASILRPWYVIGPGHWWPVFLKPFFWLGSLHSSWAAKLKHVNTVTIEQIINTLMVAINTTPVDIKYYEIEDIIGQPQNYQMPAAFWALPKVQ